MAESKNQEKLNKELLDAARADNIEKVKAAINHGASVNCRIDDWLYHTPLHLAAENATSVDVLKVLLSAGADVNALNFGNRTPLHLAAEYAKSVDVLKVLLSAGADVNALTFGGQTPLHRAAINAKAVDIVQVLLSSGANVNAKDEDKQTPLHLTARNAKSVDVLTVLLSAGADVNASDDFGQTPLHRAAIDAKTVDIVQVLLSSGANVNAKDKDKWTPLHLAAKNTESVDVIKVLLSSGAYVDAKDEHDWTPLHCAAYYIKNTSVFDLLIQAGADLYKKTRYGVTPLDYAKTNHNNEVRALIQAYMSGKKKVIGLVKYLQQLDLQSELHKILHNESSYESYDMRVMVVGKYGVGKTTLVMLLVGDDIPSSRTPTDGISLLEGRCALDITTKEWIHLDKDSYIEEEFIYSRMLMPPTEDDTESQGIKQTGRRQLNKLGDKTSGNRRSSKEESSVELDDKCLMPKAEQGLTSFSSATSLHEVQENVISEPDSDRENRAADGDQGEKSLGVATQESSDSDSKTPESMHPEIKFTKSKMKTKLSKNEYKKRLELALKNGTYKMQMGRLFFWDFGGQYVFYTTHQSFLTYRALFLVIFDGTENLHDKYPSQEIIPGQNETANSAVFLQYWVNSILTYCKTVSSDIPKILFVATHKDKFPKEKVEERRTIIFDEVDKLFQDHEGRNHLVLDHRIFVNARDANDPEIKTLKKIIAELTFNHPCWGERMPTSWVPLELEITELVRKGKQIISFQQLEQLNNDSKVSVLDQKALKSFLLIQHSLGKIVYFDTPKLKDFVIINPLYMIDVTKSFVTAKWLSPAKQEVDIVEQQKNKYFWPKDSKGQETFKNMAEHGLINKRDLFSLWKRKQFAKIFLYSEYIFQMLLHLDIIAEQRRYDLNTGSRLEAEALFVPCMLTNRNPTDYLETMCVPEYAVGLAFVFKGAILPPALPNRLISACLNIWALKTYKHLDKIVSMLFSGFIVLNYDKSHEVVICVESHRILLFIVHKRDQDLIVKDIATSVRQSMEESLTRISDFYQRCTTGQSSNQLPFHTQHACPELTCFHPASELLTNKGFLCPGHSKQYKIDVWYQNKKKIVCEENCEGLSKDALVKTPSDPELLRLSLQFNPEMMYTLAIHLGVTDQEWKYMEKNHPQNAELANYLILIQWREKHNGKFGDVFNALSDMEVDTHNLCQVRRTKIRQSDLPEKHLGSIPTDEILDALAPEVGPLSFQLGVELGRKVTELENIQYNNKLDVVEQSREVLHNWRDEQTIKATFEVLEQALVNVGRGSMCLKRIMEEVGVKQHQFQQHETQRKKRCYIM